MIKIIVSLLAVGMLSGCGTNYHIQTDMNRDNYSEPRQLALFLDGTANDMESETNVARLSHIVKNQDLPNLHVFYNEGVGTGYRLIGGATGWGIDKDVAEAYAFLSKFHLPDSKLYIFGFSRGAYTSRILAGMIYSVGVYDLSSLTEKQRLSVSKKLYAIYKNQDKSACNRSKKIIAECGNQDRAAIRQKSDELVGRIVGDVRHVNNAEIDLLGLWDTVEALGFVPTIRAMGRNLFGIKKEIEVVQPNGRYIDQICNVKHAMHALSLDDNRQYVFTPISIKTPYVVRRCKGESLDKVQEVWFSGAHADVGGGYTPTEQPGADNELRDVSLAGISLNWMLNEIWEEEDLNGLLQNHVSVPANALAFSHDAERSKIFYERATRKDVMTAHYDLAFGSDGVGEKAFSIHESVFERLESIRPVPEQESGAISSYGYDSGWYRHALFKDCFIEGEDGILLKGNCSRIRKVTNKNQ